MSWSQPPYNPAYSQAGGQWGGGSSAPSYNQQPYNPAAYASQPPPTQSLSYSQASLPPGGYSQGPPGGYGGPPPPAAQPPGLDPELWGWFQSVDADKSGKITAVELRQALLNSNWSHFNAETCRILIGMFDANKDGTIDVYEFAALWKYVQEWKGCFDRFDRDKSGNIDASELQQALNAFGYRLSMEFCNVCTRVFDRTDQHTMKFDDFIQCCVMLRSLTDSFKRMDSTRSGTITISYEQFLEMAIDNSIS